MTDTNLPDARTPDTHAPIKVASFASEMEANMLTNALKREGIDAHTLGGAISGFKAETPSEVKVVVPAAQLDAANRVMKQLEADTVVDWAAVDIGDPTDPSQDKAATNPPTLVPMRTRFSKLVWFGLAVSLIWLACSIWQVLVS